MQLGLNIDHVATLRQARYAGMLEHFNSEPIFGHAIAAIKKGGANSVTLHAREDARHVQKSDVSAAKKEGTLPLNLEMAATEEMISFALSIQPEYVCLVPESREEITTEGGLDVSSGTQDLLEKVKKLQDKGMKVSLFVDPDKAQIEASAKIRPDMVELHTGCFANASGAKRDEEIHRLINAAKATQSLGIQVNAGHGINYNNILELAKVPYLTELNIGHSIISRAIFVGLEQATREMRSLVDRLETI